MLKSLFFMRLNTAGIVIGWLSVLGSFVTIIAEGVALGYADVISQMIVKHSESSNTQIDYDAVHSLIIILLSVSLAINALNLLSSAMLLAGIMKERHLMLLPWLINSGIVLAGGILFNTVAFVTHPLEPAAIFGVLVLALNIYIYMGIYALFKQIQFARDQQNPLIQHQPTQGNSYPNYTKM